MPMTIQYQQPQQPMQGMHHGHAHHAHAHPHHGHAHAPQQQQQPAMAGPGPAQMMMQVVQQQDGSWGLAPYMPPAAMGQTPAVAAPPQPSWLGLAAVLGGLGVAGWWAYKKWMKGDGDRRREPEPERIREYHRGYGRGDGDEYGRYGHRHGRGAREISGRESRSEERNRPDERRSARSEGRMLAEFKQFMRSTRE